MQTIIMLVLVTSLVSMIIGAIWYSPLMFGKFWMMINGTTFKNKEEYKKMQKAAIPLYALQFVFTIITNFILILTLSYFNVPNLYGLFIISFVMWLGFIMPTQAGEVLWNNMSNKNRLFKFLISTSYQLVAIFAATYIYSIW